MCYPGTANFFRSLRLSPCHEDIRTTTGSNLKLVEEASGLNPWVFSSTRLKEELIKQEMVEVQAQDARRVSYLVSRMGLIKLKLLFD